MGTRIPPTGQVGTMGSCRLPGGRAAPITSCPLVAPRGTSMLEPAPRRAPNRPRSPLRGVLVQPASLDDWWDRAGVLAHGRPVHGGRRELRGQEAAGQG